MNSSAFASRAKPALSLARREAHVTAVQLVLPVLGGNGVEDGHHVLFTTRRHYVVPSLLRHPLAPGLFRWLSSTGAGRARKP